MTKTYSVAIQNKFSVWLTNWNKYFNLDDIEWDKVEKYCLDHHDLAYGYYYGHNSCNLTSSRCRTVVKVLNSNT